MYDVVPARKPTEVVVSNIEKGDIIGYKTEHGRRVLVFQGRPTDMLHELVYNPHDNTFIASVAPNSLTLTLQGYIKQQLFKDLCVERVIKFNNYHDAMSWITFG